MNNKSILSIMLSILAIALILFAYFYYFKKDPLVTVETPMTSSTTIEYRNNEYGFVFTLPASWQGYTVINETWKGNMLTNTQAQSGPKLLIRNPKWTANAPYEDLPILVFTIGQWDAYISDNFTVSAAPVPATELARNNVYVFALPPRWDFDYSLDFKEAQNIISGKPLDPFDITEESSSNSKLNINVVCENALTYMTFPDAETANTFVLDCKAGKHPEVIEKFKNDMNLGDGAVI